MSVPAQTRCYDWHPAAAGGMPLATMSGLEFFRRLADGTLPPQPIASTIGWTVDAVERGVLRLKFEPRPWLFHAAGVLHGGIMAILLDSAMAGAAMSTLAQGQACTTVQLSVTPVRAVGDGSGAFMIEGRITNSGRRVIVATGTMTDLDGKLYAQGSTSCLIL